jgi:L-rhamnose mutarotase
MEKSLWILLIHRRTHKLVILIFRVWNLYFSGTTQALATYVNIGTIKDLIIKISPKIVKFLFVHKVINYSFFLFYFPNLIFHILLYHVQNISLDSKCFKFIWNNKPDKVKWNTVVGKLGNGGLKMIDVQSYFMSLKASWVSRLVSNQLVNWKVIPCKYFAKLGKKWLVFSQNLDNITVNRVLWSNLINLFPHLICFLTSAKFKGALVWPPPILFQLRSTSP